MHGNTRWTEEMNERLSALWAAGLSATQIAAALGCVSRNAVLGKVHRLGLPARAKEADKIPRARKPRPERRYPLIVGRILPHILPHILPRTVPHILAAPKTLHLEPVIPVAPGCRFDELTATSCRWPVGEVGEADFGFCGEQTIPHASYCAHHMRIAYLPVPAARGRPLRRWKAA
jgi:GcrA cell cycle regulator